MSNREPNSTADNVVWLGSPRSELHPGADVILLSGMCFAERVTPRMTANSRACALPALEYFFPLECNPNWGRPTTQLSGRSRSSRYG